MASQHDESNMPVKREGKPCYLRDAVIVAALVFGSPYSVPILGYIAGLRNDVGLEFTLVWLTVCGLWPVLLICLVVLIDRMVHMWPRHIRDRQRLWLLRFGVLAAYVLGTVDIPAVQAWLSTLSPEVQ